MSFRKIRDEADARGVIEAMTDHPYDARAVGLWLVDKISELEHKVSELERTGPRRIHRE